MALVENRIVLNTIMLKMEFVGWLYKFGIHFLGFMDSLHKVGMNTILNCISLRSSSMGMVQARVNKSSTYLRGVHDWTFNPPPLLIKAKMEGWRFDKNGWRSQILIGIPHLTHNALTPPLTMTIRNIIVKLLHSRCHRYW